MNVFLNMVFSPYLFDSLIVQSVVVGMMEVSEVSFQCLERSYCSDIDEFRRDCS